MTYIFQAVWPILDNARTARDLITEATADLERLAAQSHARLTGPPIWIVHPASAVPGFRGHAPGRVLLARAPATAALLPGRAARALLADRGATA